MSELKFLLQRVDKDEIKMDLDNYTCKLSPFDADLQKVGQYLRGVIKIRKAVPYGHAAVFCQQLNIALLKAAKLYSVIEAAQHLRRVLKGCLFAHLAV